MTVISQLIEQKKEELLNESKKQTRFFINISKQDYLDLFQLKLDFILTRKHKKPLKFIIHKDIECHIHQLYYYLTGSDEFKGDPQRGILALGDLGCGKTTLIKAFCELLNDFERKRITILHSKKLSSELGMDVKITDYEKKPLFIDDIGKETKDVNNFGTIINPIPDVFALRAEYGAWTFGTGNYKLSTYGTEKFYGKTTQERMIEMFNIMEIKGKSQRKEVKI